ncbi:hypothetical protein ASF12_13940 [Paenibacillus sp. Leaf72]|nr:hypothetical protein ASF12_13940 [Paenibacillus sp. Leaf72]
MYLKYDLGGCKLGISIELSIRTIISEEVAAAERRIRESLSMKAAETLTLREDDWKREQEDNYKP